MDIWYGFVKNVIRIYTAFFLHYQVQGKDNIPAGPKIIVGNHPYATDGFALPFIFQEKLHFAIQENIFEMPFVGRMLALAGQIPVRVGQGHEMLKTAKVWLEKGHDIVIFPEGRLNLGREFHRAGSGAALLALQTGAPVVPLGIWSPPEFARMVRNTFMSQPATGGWQLGGKLYIKIGEPLFLSGPDDPQRLYRHLRECTNLIMSTVADLVQQSYNESSDPSAA